MGKMFVVERPRRVAVSGSIWMSLNVTFRNMWGIIRKEWKEVSGKTIGILILGLLILISSIVVVALAQQ